MDSQILRSLRLFDPNIILIAGSARHVTLYKFDGQEWERLQFEGPLFVIKRCAFLLSLIHSLETKTLLIAGFY